MDVEKAIRAYIEPLVHLSLATAVDNAPWVCEVHFACDDDLNIYFRSLASRRHSQQIDQNPKVAGNIVRQFELGESPVGVYFEGTAERLGPGKERDMAFASMREKLQTKPEALEEADRPDSPQFYKITVDNWYIFGRFGDAPGQKYQLHWDGGRARSAD